MTEFANAAERQRQREAQMRAAERQYAAILARGEERLARIHKHACDQLFEHDNPRWFEAINRLKTVPVTIHEFMDSKEFLGEQIEIWPSLRGDIIECNPDILAGEQPVTQVLAGGATGTGKTEFTRVGLAYQTYMLTCFKQPQRLWGLPPSTQLVIAFMSTNSGVVKRVLYTPFRHMFLNMPYTQRWVGYDTQREATLLLDGGIEVVPMLANVQAMVGQAIIASMLDEVNFMQIVENSKQVAGARGKGGYFDQAELVFRTITRRRTGRFGKPGRPSIGATYAISSTRYKDDFLDRRIAQVKELKEQKKAQDIRTYRRKQYEVQPDIDWSEPFRVLVGTESYATRILKDHEQPGVHYPENAWVESVPGQYYDDFHGDPDGALRDVIGEASGAINPFFKQRHKIVQAAMRANDRGFLPWVIKQDVDLEDDGMPQIDEDNLPDMAERQRDWHLHIDLSRTGDRCGIAMSREDGVQKVANKDANVVEVLPRIATPFTCSIKPSASMPLDIAEVRQWCMMLKVHYGFNIVTATFDGFDSQESIQLWRKAGVQSFNVSTDTSNEPYEDLRAAAYSDRWDCVDHHFARQEIIELEKNEKKNKIDHPPAGSKDVADAIAGSVWCALRSRNLRQQVRVSAGSEPVAHLQQTAQRERPKPKRRQSVGRR